MTAHGLAPVGHGYKVLQAPPPIPYPALFGVFRKSATPVEPEESRDTNLKERIEDYIVQSKAGRPQTASMRRTPADTELSATMRKTPSSPVARACVPPQSSML